MEIMRRAAEMAQKESLRIAIENEPGFWCDTGAHTARLIRDVDSPALGANWDPANAYGTDETPFPDGYRALKGLVYNVHAKDTLKGSLVQCVPIGDGVIDWQGQMSELLKDRPVGHVTIETHCHPLVDNSRRNVETLQALMGVPVR
jgi:sugar phosphate isomerase/epimerase